MILYKQFVVMQHIVNFEIYQAMKTYSSMNVNHRQTDQQHVLWV